MERREKKAPVLGAIHGITSLLLEMSLISPATWKIAAASDEYKQRRKQQMLKFAGAAVLTLFSTRLAYKSLIARQYLPTLFQGNHHPPTSYSFVTDAAVAVGTGTLLCGTVSSMAIFGTCWIMDVSSFREFGWRMKQVMGGYDRQRELAAQPMDEESEQIQEALNDLLLGKYDDE
jgi:hypothetical protein